MTSNEDSDYEVQKLLVFADFNNQLLPQDITSSCNVKIIGIESNHPMLEINGNVFRGTYDDTMGTMTLFEKDDSYEDLDPVYDHNCNQFYKMLAQTNKAIAFQRVFLDKSDAVKEKENLNDSTKDIDRNLKLDLTYDEAILEFPIEGNKK